jgi:hypothetical protein
MNLRDLPDCSTAGLSMLVAQQTASFHVNAALAEALISSQPLQGQRLMGNEDALSEFVKTPSVQNHGEKTRMNEARHQIRREFQHGSSPVAYNPNNVRTCRLTLTACTFLTQQAQMLSRMPALSLCQICAHTCNNHTSTLSGCTCINGGGANCVLSKRLRGCSNNLACR